MNYVNLPALLKGLDNFSNKVPFDHCIIDDFLLPKTLEKIQSDFLDYESSNWYVYKNKLEDKKALNNWNIFPKFTYDLFSYFVSDEFVKIISDSIGEELIPDPGLHGGGWHIHGSGGNLNPHLDYSIHPKLNLERVINIIIYVGDAITEEHGGHLGLWSHDLIHNRPNELIQEIFPKKNRAVIFNTTQNSWHGMSRPLLCPEGVFRKSLAIYYLRKPSPEAFKREKALFAARDNQLHDSSIEELIKKRASGDIFNSVYVVDDN